MPPDSANLDIQPLIEEIWKRSRTNGFAHRSAAEFYSKTALDYFKREVVFSLLSILLTILYYMANSAEAKEVFLPVPLKVVSLLAVILSIMFTLISLIVSVVANVSRFDKLASEHEYQHGACLEICQRTRRSKNPHMTDQEKLMLWENAEEDFRMLKARGKEPSDKFFQEANKLMSELKQDPVVRAMQSFPGEKPPKPPI
jgi:uncharacterized Tic20 family protein